MKKLEKITPWEVDFGRWYTDVIKGGELIEYGPVKGTIMFKPNSYAIWDNIKIKLDSFFKEKAIQNVYLPMLIPESFINKEKEHIEGFAPELATVTHVGGKKLHENLYIRPTSEVLFADYFKKSIHSYNDLPMLLNQWVSVMRWEKTTNPFLRTSEFLWQEGHTSFSEPLEARRFARSMIKGYAKFVENYLAIPTIVGKKTPREKFAGACNTYTIEGMMKDGKALQMGTSHYLGQKFSKNFDITFKNKDNEQEHVYQTSFGVSTRLIGAIIMTHGDDRGIVIPPKIAPTQIDILELFGNKNPGVREAANKIYKTLKKTLRVRLDDSDKQPGFKAANSEIQGTPLRIEVGPKDLENEEVTFVRRDTLEKTKVKIVDISTNAKQLLNTIQNDLLKRAKERMQSKITRPTNFEEFKEAIEQGKFALVPFCGDSTVEEKIQELTGATARCLPLKNWAKEKKEVSNCFLSGKETKKWVFFAKAY